MSTTIEQAEISALPLIPAIDTINNGNGHSNGVSEMGLNGHAPQLVIVESPTLQPAPLSYAGMQEQLSQYKIQQEARVGKSKKEKGITENGLNRLLSREAGRLSNEYLINAPTHEAFSHAAENPVLRKALFTKIASEIDNDQARDLIARTEDKYLLFKSLQEKAQERTEKQKRLSIQAKSRSLARAIVEEHDGSLSDITHFSDIQRGVTRLAKAATTVAFDTNPSLMQGFSQKGIDAAITMPKKHSMTDSVTAATQVVSFMARHNEKTSPIFRKKHVYNTDPTIRQEDVADKIDELNAEALALSPNARIAVAKHQATIESEADRRIREAVAGGEAIASQGLIFPSERRVHVNTSKTQESQESPIFNTEEAAILSVREELQAEVEGEPISGSQGRDPMRMNIREYAATLGIEPEAIISRFMSGSILLYNKEGQPLHNVNKMYEVQAESRRVGGIYKHLPVWLSSKIVRLRRTDPNLFVVMLADGSVLETVNIIDDMEDFMVFTYPSRISSQLSTGRFGQPRNSGDESGWLTKRRKDKETAITAVDANPEPLAISTPTGQRRRLGQFQNGGSSALHSQSGTMPEPQPHLDSGEAFSQA